MLEFMTEICGEYGKEINEVTKRPQPITALLGNSQIVNINNLPLRQLVWRWAPGLQTYKYPTTNTFF